MKAVAPQNTVQVTNERKVSVAVVVMMVMIGSREAKEDVEARSAERGRQEGRKEGGVKVQKREQLALRR